VGQEPIEQDDLRGGLYEPVVHRVKVALGRGNQQTEDKGGQRCDHAGPQLYHILGIVTQVMIGQQRSKVHAERYAAYDATAVVFLTPFRSRFPGLLFLFCPETG
jgi:hypothetical protein